MRPKETWCLHSLPPTCCCVSVSYATGEERVQGLLQASGCTEGGQIHVECSGECSTLHGLHDNFTNIVVYLF